jgi:hypothetical protein
LLAGGLRKKLSLNSKRLLKHKNTLLRLKSAKRVLTLSLIFLQIKCMPVLLNVAGNINPTYSKAAQPLFIVLYDKEAFLKIKSLSRKNLLI